MECRKKEKKKKKRRKSKRKPVFKTLSSLQDHSSNQIVIRRGREKLDIKNKQKNVLERPTFDDVFFLKKEKTSFFSLFFSSSFPSPPSPPPSPSAPLPTTAVRAQRLPGFFTTTPVPFHSRAPPSPSGRLPPPRAKRPEEPVAESDGWGLTGKTK